MRSKSLRFLGVPAFVALVALCGLSDLARGEGAPPPAGAAPNGSTSPSGAGSGRGVGVFNDGVFAVDQAPAAAPAASSPGGRYMGDAPDYNSEQQAQWKAACAAQRNVDARAYRECYLREKAATQERVRQSFERVERGQAGRFRSAAPASPLDTAPAARMPSDDRGLDPDNFVGKDSDREKENVD